MSCFKTDRKYSYIFSASFLISVPFALFHGTTDVEDYGLRTYCKVKPLAILLPIAMAMGIRNVLASSGVARKNYFRRPCLLT